MKILHVALGFAPYRSGGLTKYCEDLMEQQLYSNHQVGLLWPGRFGIFNKKISIKKSNKNGIISYELINPLPVALLNGIRDVDAYTKHGNMSFLIKFLNEEQIDVIHIHSFMGIYKELVSAARELKIRMIYTAHDYSLICPKVNLFTVDNNNCEGKDLSKCYDCCRDALSINRIKLMQSILYRRLKNFNLVQKARKKTIKKYEENTSSIVEDNNHLNEYKRLQDFYVQILRQMDIIHFNSYQTKDIFSEFIKVDNSVVMPVMHKNISDHRKKKVFTNQRKLGYLGPCRSYKGFWALKDILDDLILNEKFTLSIYDNTDLKESYIEKHGRYAYHELEGIFDELDVIIVPSICRETFGFIVLEAISYGVPVIVSDNVGAKYIVDDYACGYVYKDEFDLKKILKQILNGTEKLENWNKNIVENCEMILRFDEYVKKILYLYDSKD